MEYGNLYWRVTNQCDSNCFMCLLGHAGSENHIKGYEEKLLEGANRLGFKTIVITGGEPTMRDDVPELIHLIASYGFKVRLDTNGNKADKKYLTEIKDSLYLLGLPLQGSDAASHDFITRKKGSFERVKNRAAIARELNIPLKITTAVCRTNFEDIENMAKYLASEIHPAIWGLNAIVKRSMDPKIYEKDKIDYEEFDVMKNKLLQNSHPFKFSFCAGHVDSDRAYIIVNPDFTVCMNKGESEEVLGDLKKEKLELIVRRANLDQQLHEIRFEATNL